jgi:hypothetical protein
MEIQLIKEPLFICHQPLWTHSTIQYSGLCNKCSGQCRECVASANEANTSIWGENMLIVQGQDKKCFSEHDKTLTHSGGTKC